MVAELPSLPETKRQGDQTAGAAAAAKSCADSQIFPCFDRCRRCQKPLGVQRFTHETQVFAELLFCEELIDIF